MVSIALFIAFALYRPAHAQYGGTLTIFYQWSQTNLHTAPTNIANGTNIKCMKVTLIGLRSAGVSNAAAIYVGPTSNSQPYIIYPGERHIIETQPGTQIRLNDWWFNTPTTSDGIVVIYQ